MNKLKILLSQVLSRIAKYLSSLAIKLAQLSVVEEQIVDDLEGLFPHSFTTFKEGMASSDYCTRHDAAAKLVGWYLHGNGHPLVEELVRASEILLENSSATSGDVSLLVEAFVDQASAVTDADREAAEQRESAIYDRVAIKVEK